MNVAARHKIFQGASLLIYGVVGFSVWFTAGKQQGGVIILGIFLIAAIVGGVRLRQGLQGDGSGNWSGSGWRRWTVSILSLFALLIAVLSIFGAANA